MFWSAGIFRFLALPAATIPSPAVWGRLGPLMASTSSPEQFLCVPTPPAPTCDSHPGSMLRGSRLPIPRFAGDLASRVLSGTNTRCGFASAGHHRRAKSLFLRGLAKLGLRRIEESAADFREALILAEIG